MSLCFTWFPFSFCLFHPSCLPSSIARGRTTGFLTFVGNVWGNRQTMHKNREVGFLFFCGRCSSQQKQLSTTSAVDISESVQFVSQWTTVLGSFRMSGCSINLSKDIWVFLEWKAKAGTVCWAVCWAFTAEALQDVELLTCKQVHFSPL